jgi:hypothetical protein
MMGPRLAAIYEFVTDRPWERQIGEPVAMKVAELDPAHPELDAAEAMRRGTHPGPPQYLLGDAVMNAGHSTRATGKRGRGFPSSAQNGQTC